MAKKNSSKTATEKAISASEPRTISFKGWQGVNFVDSPLTWNPLEDFHADPRKFNQTDLPNNFLMVQNNVNTTDLLGLETRMDSIKLAKHPHYEGVEEGGPLDWKFTGVCAMYKKWMFCVVRKNENTSGTSWREKIVYRDITQTPTSPDSEITGWPSSITPKVGATSNPTLIEICELGFFEGNLVATARDYNANPDTGLLLLASVTVSEDGSSISVKGMDWSANPPSESATDVITDTPKISPLTNRPGVKPVITAKGTMASADSSTDAAPVRIEVKFCYTNRLGSTLTQTDANCATKYVELSPALWSARKYVRISPAAGDTVDVTSVSGIDLYARDTENIDWVFIGHVNVTRAQVQAGSWYYDWYGNMTDISQWVTSQLMVPTDNTTHGPDATHFDSHDSRIYFWGMPSKPYRLWVGGNPGSEFSVARGLGGAWVDIEPGSGYDVKGTAKWKTTSGANIITIMCGNQNTTKIRRFNLVETNLSLTNEISYKSYMYEEVSNVVGCNSRWGYGVYDEGLYSLNRYGLMLTTMAAEYNNQMKNQKVSDAIEPIFTNSLGRQLSDGRMVCINGVIYIALSEDDNEIGLGNVILCYDTSLKAWYTWTHDQTLGLEDLTDDDRVLHIFAIDSDEWIEGLGTITATEVRLYPVTGEQEPVKPPFQVLIESGEIAPRQPMQAYWYLQQMELRFDYFVGDPEDPATVLVEGVDYYGRYFQIEKKLNYKQRNWQPYNDNGAIAHHKVLPNGPEWTEVIEQRNYTEWIRIDKLVQSVRIRIKGRARFRLTHINAKVYQQADNISTPYGYDASDSGYNAKGQPFKIHHYINDYNNLRRAVVS